METVDFKKTMKTLYTAKPEVREVAAPPGVFIAKQGKGEPGGKTFGEAIQGVFATVYTVKFALKAAARGDFKVGPLECLWLSDPNTTPRNAWEWRVMVRVPDSVTAEDLKAAQRQMKEKKGLDTADVKRVAWKGGLALQYLHIGPYDTLCDAYHLLMACLEEHDYRMAGPSHEIYLNAPCRTAPGKLKTIVLMYIRKS